MDYLYFRPQLLVWVLGSEREQSRRHAWMHIEQAPRTRHSTSKECCCPQKHTRVCVWKCTFVKEDGMVVRGWGWALGAGSWGINFHYQYYHPYLLDASARLFFPLAKLSSNASFWLCAEFTNCFRLCLPAAIALTGLCATCSPAARSSSLCRYS